VFVLIDGLADYKIKWEADGKLETTLERAKTPVMDALAS